MNYKFCSNFRGGKKKVMFALKRLFERKIINIYIRPIYLNNLLKFSEKKGNDQFSFFQMKKFI